jgi:hypothetical protein
MLLDTMTMTDAPSLYAQALADFNIALAFTIPKSRRAAFH